jgi:hypothetical protein
MGVAVPPPRPNAGQASTEYVALIALVCAVVAGAAAVGSAPGIAGKVVAAVRHGICLVAGGVCTPGEARAAGLAPCLVHARAERERLGGRLLVVRLGRGDSLLVERRSDGSASVSFADGGGAGASVGVGLQIPGGPGVTMRGGAGLQFGSGRTWEFASFEAAARFVRRWAPGETLRGEARGLLPGGGDGPPPPDSTYKEGGAYGEFAAGVRGGAVRADESGEVGAVFGRRLGRDGSVTWFNRVDAEVAGRLGLVLGALQAHHAGDVGMEATLVDGRAVEVRLRGAARVHWDAALGGPARSLADLAAKLRDAPREPGGVGRRVEASVALDLTDPANREAVAGVLDVLRLRVRPADWDDRVRALATRLDAAGEVDVRVLRVGLERRDVSAEVALGLGAGAAYERTTEVRELVRAWSLRAGGSLREREDCLPA